MLPHLSRKNPERDSFGVFTTKLLFCVDRAHLAILAHTLELDLAVDQSEQRIVLADTDVVAVDTESAGFYKYRAIVNLVQVSTRTRAALIASPVWFVLLWIGYALKKRSQARAAV